MANSDVVRWQPKLNDLSDRKKPMYMSVHGDWVNYSDFCKVSEENERLRLELAKAYLKLNNVIKDDGERYAVG